MMLYSLSAKTSANHTYASCIYWDCLFSFLTYTCLFNVVYSQVTPFQIASGKCLFPFESVTSPFMQIVCPKSERCALCRGNFLDLTRPAKPIIATLSVGSTCYSES